MYIFRLSFLYFRLFSFRLFEVVHVSFLRLLRSFSSFFCFVLLEFIDDTDKRLISLGVVSQFRQKYDDTDIALMAFQIPIGTRLDIPTVWLLYPKLSKRHVVEVINFRKNQYQKLRS